MKRHLVVIDLEATCDDAGAVLREEMEIIEIGAVMVEWDTWRPLEEFQTFVRPIRHPRLTAFCGELTTITQAEVDAAETLPEVLPRLATWLGAFSRPQFGSWGSYDRRQFDQDIRFHRVADPLPEQHHNLKHRFSEKLGTRRRFGMKRALERVGIPLEGTHHRALDDARNIVRLLPHCF